MSLKRRRFTKEFKIKILREVARGQVPCPGFPRKPTAPKHDPGMTNEYTRQNRGSLQLQSWHAPTVSVGMMSIRDKTLLSQLKP